MDRYILIPKEQFISMQQKILLQSGENLNPSLEEERCAQESQLTKQEELLSVDKPEELSSADRQVIVGGSESRLSPPGIPNKGKKRNIVFKKPTRGSWKLLWQSL